MGRKASLAAVAAACILLWGTCFAAEQGMSTEQPSAVFPESHFEFAPVPDGAEVLHDYIVRNQGAAPLDIVNVKTG
jgi:hypothetical protein